MTRRPGDVRILQVAREIRPGFGVSGPAYELERQFQALGYRCERFTLEDVRRRASRGQGDVRQDLLRFWRDVVAFSFWGSLKLWWRLRRDPDPNRVVVCHVDALVGDLFVLRSLHKSYLAKSGGIRSRVLRNPLHGLVLLRDWIRFRFRTHRHIVALSQANADDLVRLYDVPQDSISVIPNGVDRSRFRPSSTRRQQVRQELGIAAKAFVLCFVANEFERKGLAMLLDALGLLQEKGIEIELVVAGGDSLEPFRAATDTFADRVHYLGYRSDVERLYAAADAFALPTVHELSPLVGLEAMASGLPLLMTPEGGAREYLDDGRTGYFIRTAPDLAHRIEGLAENPSELRRMSGQARIASESYDWSRIAQRFVDLIEGEVQRRIDAVDRPRYR